MALVESTKVTMMFGGLKALSDISLSIEPGEIVAPARRRSSIS
jgi:ABC-type branched-subunit amino acid transport system ATPase component